MSEQVHEIDPAGTVPGCRDWSLLGLWSIDGRTLAGMAERLKDVDISALQQPGPRILASTSIVGYERLTQFYPVTPEGVAVIQINGPLTKHSSKFDSVFGMSSTLMARQAIRAANRDDGVSGILLHIDSPGGQVAGTQELTDDIVASNKPIHAYIEDAGYSAGYRIASVADHVSINAAGGVGSIGTIAVAYDVSQQAEMLGIKVHTITSDGADRKGDFVPGKEITDEMLVELKAEVNKAHQGFRDDIIRGRRLTPKQAEALATGEIWTADEALERGLVDAVETIESALARFGVETMTTSNDGQIAQQQAPPEPVAATVPELKAAFDDDSFIVECAAQGLDMSEATAEWAERQTEKLNAAIAKIAELEAKANEVPATESNGIAALTDAPGDVESVDPIALMESRIGAKLAANPGMKRNEAFRAIVTHDHPEDLQAYTEAVAEKKKRFADKRTADAIAMHQLR